MQPDILNAMVAFVENLSLLRCKVVIIVIGNHIKSSNLLVDASEASPCRITDDSRQTDGGSVHK